MDKTNKIILVIVVLIVLIIGIYYIGFDNGSSTVGVSTNTSNNDSQNQPINPETNTQTPFSTQSQTTTNTNTSTNTSNTQTNVAPANVTVNITNFSFNPSTLNIKTGTKVTWINNDTVAHTITSDSSNLLHSPLLSPGQSFSFTFNTPGSENYHCSVHPMMTASINIQS